VRRRAEKTDACGYKDVPAASQRKSRAVIMNKSSSGSQAGFTLIELLVVVIILGVLAGLIVPRIVGRPEEARRTKARLQIESLEGALKLFYLDNGFYPDTEQGLAALTREPETGRSIVKWREGGYLEKGKIPKDPWGNSYRYLSPGVHNKDFDLWSPGPDGEDGGEGRDRDVTNWDEEG
jgi:general secretion pathway protein G